MAKNVLKQLIDTYKAVFNEDISITETSNENLNKIFSDLDNFIAKDVNNKTLPAINVSNNKQILKIEIPNETSVKDKIRFIKEEKTDLKQRNKVYLGMKQIVSELNYDEFNNSEIAFPTEDDDDIDLVSKTLYENNILQIQYVFNILTSRWAIVFRHNNRGFSFNSLHEACIFEFDAEDQFYVVYKNLEIKNHSNQWDTELDKIATNMPTTEVIDIPNSLNVFNKKLIEEGGSKKKKSAKNFEFF